MRLVRENAEQIDGKTYTFVYGWEADRADYIGEQVWLHADPDYPEGAPSWLASGDLVPVETEGAATESK